MVKSTSVVADFLGVQWPYLKAQTYVIRGIKGKIFSPLDLQSQIALRKMWDTSQNILRPGESPVTFREVMAISLG